MKGLIVLLLIFVGEAHAGPSRLRSLPMTEESLLSLANEKQRLIHPFQVLSERARQRNIKIYLFGGAAVSYLIYSTWIYRQYLGDEQIRLHRNQFEIDQILDPLQDIDLVIAGDNGHLESVEDLRAMQQLVGDLFKTRRVDVFGLRTSWMDLHGKDRPALLDNGDFLDQHLDSHSTILYEIATDRPSELLDLKAPNNDPHYFISLLLRNKIKYYFSERHASTSRAKLGMNPDIFSTLRYLTKVFRYGLSMVPEDIETVRRVAHRFNPNKIYDGYQITWISFQIRKMLSYVANLDDAYKLLDELRLREKLSFLPIDHDLRALLNREPLPESRDDSIGSSRKTAGELGITHVVHGTRRASKNIMEWSPYGTVNVFISRMNTPGEGAAFGNGFYTRRGQIGALNQFETYIVFRVDPHAELGRDFLLPEGDIVLWQTKKYLTFDREIEKHKNLGLELVRSFFVRNTPSTDDFDEVMDYLKEEFEYSKGYRNISDPKLFYSRDWYAYLGDWFSAIQNTDQLLQFWKVYVGRQRDSANLLPFLCRRFQDISNLIFAEYFRARIQPQIKGGTWTANDTWNIRGFLPGFLQEEFTKHLLANRAWTKAELIHLLRVSPGSAVLRNAIGKEAKGFRYYFSRCLGSLRDIEGMKSPTWGPGPIGKFAEDTTY